MFQHIYITRLKCILRDRTLVFWTLVFPIVLAVFFEMGFSNLITAESFHPFPVAVVNDSAYQKNESFRSALKNVSEGKGRLFILTETTKEAAEKLLNDHKIYGYLTVGQKISVTVQNTGFEQSILRSFADSYMQTASAAGSILSSNPLAEKELAESLKKQLKYTRETSAGSAPLDKTLNYFYSLIGMACLYGSFWGLKEVNDIQANLSERAARVNLAPVHKLKMFATSMCASLTIHFLEILLFLLFLRYCLNIEFGTKTWLVVLTSFVGSMVGLAFGAFVGAAVKTGSEGIKAAVLVGFSMLGSFLAGMMYQDMKYIISQNAPIIGYLNPVNLLTDSYYCLYYYSTYSRYALNMVLLCAFILLFGTFTYFIIRRQKYASL
jgi:ABC-2 type transport system permease protein